MSGDYKNKVLNFLFLDPMKYIFNYISASNTRNDRDTTTTELSERQQNVWRSQLLSLECFDHFKKIIRDNLCDNQLLPIRLIGPRGSGKSALYNFLAVYFFNGDSQAMPPFQLIPTSYDNQSCLANIFNRIIIGHCPELTRKLNSTDASSINEDIDRHIRVDQSKDLDMFYFFRSIVDRRSELPNENLLNDTNYGIIWDFDGNVIDYNTIRPYLSASGLYILTVDLTQIIVDEDNRQEISSSKAIAYLDKIKMWITSVVGLCNQSQEMVIDNSAGVSYQLQLPCIIIVGTHVDQIASKAKLQQIYRVLEAELWQDLSTFENHICVPRISFNLNPDNSVTSMIDINADSYHRLYSLIYQFSSIMPLLKKRIAISWYAVALILYCYKWRRRPADIMTVDYTKNLIQEFTAMLTNIEMKEMLQYFHDIGLLSLNKQENNDDVVSIDWLSTILNHLMSQDDSQRDHLWMLKDIAQHHQLKEKGRVTKTFLHNLLKDNVSKSHTKYSDEQIIAILQDFGAIYPFGLNNQDQEYFVPHFLPPTPSDYQLSNFHFSDKLYVMFEKNNYPQLFCIPLELFHRLLSVGFRSVRNSDIKIYQRSTVAYLNKHDCYIIMEMDHVNVSIQFVYQILPKINDSKRVRSDSSICQTLRNILNTEMANHIPGLSDVTCSFYMKCSSCHEFTSIGHNFNECRPHVAIKCINCKFSLEAYFYIP